MAATDFAMPVLGGEKILVVESDEDTASTMTAALRLNGYNAHTVATGAAALKAVARMQPRAIILDLDLPDADPCDIIRKVRSRPNPPVVIVVTAHTDAVHRREARQAGAAEYLLKPADTTQVVRLLTRICTPATAEKG